MLVTLDGFIFILFPFNVSKNTHIINCYLYTLVHYNPYYDANPLLNNLCNMQVF